MRSKRILIDGREFVPGRKTGIGRFLEGLTFALLEADFINEVSIAICHKESLPAKLENHPKIRIEEMPLNQLGSERALSSLSGRDFDLFLSPYPKLPILGTACIAINTVHDILDLTHPLYRQRMKALFDALRMRLAMKVASLTWFDSLWSFNETRNYIRSQNGFNARIRHLAIDEKFEPSNRETDMQVLQKYGLKPGYILIIGNGYPHKNLGVLLKLKDQLKNPLLFVGTKQEQKTYWQTHYDCTGVTWVNHAEEEDLPAIIRSSFCLAQPSLVEGYGYPPLEAMASGVPAVVSDIPVLLETTGGNALVADPNDSDSWLQSFTRLEGEEKRIDCIKSGLKWVDPLRGSKGWSKHMSDVKELITSKK